MRESPGTGSDRSFAFLLVAALGATVLGLTGVACGSASTAATGPTCSSGQKTCGGVCTNTQTDPANCGTCGHPCNPGEVCSQGVCALSCGGGTTACHQACVDTNVDPANCGGCDKPCNAGEMCSQGVCALSCGGGTTECGQSCVDTNTDPANCGGCDKPCGAGEDCYQGQCYARCPLPVGSPESACNGIDDNCNGVIDEGCPTGADAPNANATATSPLEGSSTGGSAWGPDTCAPGSAMVGIYGYGGGNIDGFGVTCAPLSVVVDTTATPYTYALATGQTTKLPKHGSNVTTPYTIACPPGQVVTRIDGHYDLTARGSVTEGVHQLSLYCSAVTITGDPAGSTVALGAPTLAGTEKSGYDLTGSTQFSFACPGTVGYMASVSGRAGAWLDALKMSCYDLGLTVK